MPPVATALGAGDERQSYTDGEFLHCCILHWGLASRRLSSIYWAFTARCEALEANFYHREHVLCIPGLPELNPTEFIAVEHLHAKQKELVTVAADDAMVKTSNVPQDSGEPPSENIGPNQILCQGPLMFDPAKDAANTNMAAPDDQAKSMSWLG